MLDFELLSSLIFLVLGVGFGMVAFIIVNRIRNTSASDILSKKIKEAEETSSGIIIKAKEKAVSLLEEIKDEEKRRYQQLEKQEDRLIKKEDHLDNKEKEVEKRETVLSSDLEKVKQVKQQVDEMRDAIMLELEKVASLTKEEAANKLMDQVKAYEEKNLAIALQRLQKERRDEIEKQSVEIITTAIQRYARSHISEITTSSFSLPDEEFKGKIIGREGRNIRTLERLTGVELIVDEMPDAVIISSFDPLRREIAKLTLEKLVKDGRIQPAKIEEKVEEAKQELTKRMQEIGEEAAVEVGVYDFPIEILQILGRLNFRTSYGQNVLTHSIEVAHIAKMIATELGLDSEVAKKAALVHDIGKAIDHEVEGTHVDIGRKILKKYGVDEKVIRAMESHHDEYPYSLSEAYIVTTADILSGARPGSRRDSVQGYIKRLEDLEEIATSFSGVKNAYAVSAGRELRIFVVPEQIDDFKALQLARDIAKKIESELKYPGEIKVNVIREMRAVEYAK
ncbi:MAG: ribonuclease Y [Candidatus Liptonbacteria bacterium CG11_big_fil_rev_8_21_14_0_20_35_14]|uniref:Ribonuclease Y n=1 Tax=Candidatus Liptonbacteria bacterium CG11_big_fil_rev_8_21_14_0_20_35_14 TaxID=1974634 RepID=A0A2H0NA96_9BACT|nr:MAG: ribonuclease Y [Candidatus Liptonbacteria bacterium CG11_big_fil_rev_8_21_14_0_20_35_14]